MTTTPAYDLGVRIARMRPARADRVLALVDRFTSPENRRDVWLGYDEAQAEDAPGPLGPVCGAWRL